MATFTLPWKLRSSTPTQWVETVLADFGPFLIDHAACERKASAVGLSFVVRYPDRRELIEPMIQFAREELEHFHQVYRLIEERGLTLTEDEKDLYANRLLETVRFGREERFLDRLIVASVIEARGHERLELLADKLEDPKLRALYARLARAEGHHRNLFLDLATLYFPEETVNARLQQLLDLEAEAIASVPFRPAVH